MTDPFEKLNQAVSFKQGSSRATFRHPNEDVILSQLKTVMRNSPTAQRLIDFAESNNIDIQVLKNKEGFGFMPEVGVVFISALPEAAQGNADMIIHLAGALREAEQELEETTKRPSVNMGKEAYVQRFVDKKSDVRWHQCAVVDEISETINFTEIVDSFIAMGYHEILEGYRKDKNNVG